MIRDHRDKGRFPLQRVQTLPASALSAVPLPESSSCRARTAPGRFGLTQRVVRTRGKKRGKDVARAGIAPPSSVADPCDHVLADFVHDIRTPLQIIALCADLLTAHPTSPTGSALTLSRIRVAKDRIAALLDELVASSLPHLGAIVSHPRRVGVDDLLDNALAAMRPIAERKNVYLRVGASTALGMIDVDYEGMMRVFSNLIGNAIKFSSAGSEIKISARREHDAIRFGVRDEGIGISAVDLPKIFDRCWQANAGERQGSGLGLAIVKEIVELSHGCVGASSVRGLGTEIYFTIPWL